MPAGLPLFAPGTGIGDPARQPGAGTAAGAVSVSPIVLSTQPQWTFYAALFARRGRWARGPESRPSTPAALGRWWRGAVGGGRGRPLSAVQLFRHAGGGPSQSEPRRGVPPDGLAADLPSRSISWSAVAARRPPWESGPVSAVVWLTPPSLRRCARRPRPLPDGVWLGCGLALGGGALSSNGTGRLRHVQLQRPDTRSTAVSDGPCWPASTDRRPCLRGATVMDGRKRL